MAEIKVEKIPAAIDAAWIAAAITYDLEWGMGILQMQNKEAENYKRLPRDGGTSYT